MFDEKDHIIYKPNNNSTHKAQIGKIDNNGPAAIILLIDKFIKLNKLILI